MTNSWLVLLPPLIVLGIALFFRQLIAAMVIGLLSAALIAADFSPMSAATLVGKRFWLGVSELDTLYNFSFLFAIGVFVSLLGMTGGATAFAHSIASRLKTAKMVESAIFPFSLLLALDDYLNTLTVAHVMRPLTNRFKIARAKLAFLIQTFAGPLVILVPLSSWAALIIGQLELSGINFGSDAKILGDPFFVYLKSIPFIFYSLLMISSAWLIIRCGLSYGPMHKHELIAKETGNLWGGHKPLEEIAHEEVQHGTLSDLLLPLFTLLISVLLGIAWSGDYYLTGGNLSFIDALKNNNQTALVLFVSSIITLFVGFAQAVIKKRITLPQIPQIIKAGILLMYSAIFVVFLASLLGTILRVDLETGSYLAHKLLGSVPLYLFPLMIFITTTLISMAIGTAWGTITLMLPIAIPMYLTFTAIATPATLADLPLLFPILGALFSGAVVGDHVSPVSSAGIMAANSSGCYPLDHTITQFPYAIPAIIGCCISFFVVSFLNFNSVALNALISLIIGLIPCLSIHYVLNKRR